MRSSDNTRLSGTLGRAPGDVAQLVEHHDGIVGATGSSPVISTDVVGFTLAGFVAGEGCFSVLNTPRTHRDGSPIHQFLFTIAVEIADSAMIHQLRDFLGGVGSIRVQPAGKPQWQPQVIYAVKSIKTHIDVTVPFAETYLLPCAKRVQFETWRDSMNAYAERHNVRWGRGPSTCSEPGCGKPVRGRGLCRQHYYIATGW